MKRFSVDSPPAGWFATLLAFLLVLTPGFAAGQNPLASAATPITSAGLLGLLIGYDYSRTLQRYKSNNRFIQLIHFAAHLGFWLAGGAVLLLAAGTALPPLALIIQDINTLVARAYRLSSEDVRTPLFLFQSITRLSTAIANAPTSGEPGARLLIGLVGTLASWAAAIVLGQGLAQPQQILLRVIPLLIALMLVAIPGGEGGIVLVFGMLVALLLVATATSARHIRRWEAHQIDYSDEVGGDIRLWASILVGITLVIAWIVPLWPGNPISAWMATIGASGSGVAALERGIDRGGSDQASDRIGLSALQSLRLGNSIAQGPPQQVALEIRLNAPLPEHTITYWRMRLLEEYRNNDWTSKARVAQQVASPIQPSFAGAIVQTITDRRPDKQLLIALPDLLASSIPIRTERLPDGSLAAAAGTPPESSYTVLSRLQALAPLPEADQTAPDMTPYLAIPANLPARVRELAAAIVVNQPNQQAQALALEAYLRKLPYTYQVQALPSNGDAVDQFLFEMQSGYCTYYASSMAIMARSLGIPARIAVGYTAGSLQTDSSYIVYESDAHAWPELYINQRWQIYEPTPIRALPERNTSQPALEAQPIEQPANATNLPWSWLSVGLIALVTLAGLYYIRQRTAPQGMPDILTLAARDLEQAGTRIGIAWPHGNTLREYRDALTRHASQTDAIRLIVSLIERGRYTGKPLNYTELQQLEDARQAITENPKDR